MKMKIVRKQLLEQIAAKRQETDEDDMTEQE
jgi:hypothetical protein